MKAKNPLLAKYNALVVKKYERYNQLFLTLPFEGLLQSGTALPRFAEYALKMLKQNKNPKEILEGFFSKILKIQDPKAIRKTLILFLQFIERQVVLFDALEDSAFTQTYNLSGEGSVDFLTKKVSRLHLESKLKTILNTYRARLVLTAHPTQFYPDYIIDIIHKLSQALKSDQLDAIQETLLQLGKTSLRNAQAPSPLDEANFLLTQMRKSFYPALKKIRLPLIQLGFWPGGDRDGNPNVTSHTTIEVSKQLKNQILHIYQKELEDLKAHLTFPGVWENLLKIALRLKATRQAIRSQYHLVEKPFRNAEEFIQELNHLKNILQDKHGGLFIDYLDQLIFLVHQLGFHFASLDLRQDSGFHAEIIQQISKSSYVAFSEKEKLAWIFQNLKKPAKIKHSLNAKAKDFLSLFKNIPIIQQENGGMGLQRYIISHTQSLSDIFEVFLLAHWAGLNGKNLPLDIVPLFESLEDLDNAEKIMEALWENSFYKKQLKRRGFQQTVMLGFSDGTKDGGYMAANWAIYQCKLGLTKLAKKFGVEIIFFDGRGGPPSRGGGNTYLFYRALEKALPQNQVQLTLQGQTITTDFGTPESAQFNIEQLATAALSLKLFPDKSQPLNLKESKLLERISQISAQAYEALKQNPLFLSYLSEVTPLDYYGDLKIASRPPRRSKSLAFSDLRAIPFVGAWSQMKQNIPGYFGLGSALQKIISEGHLDTLRHLYENRLFFKTLINNAMMSLRKSNFLITAYLREDQKFGEFWNILFKEAELSKKTCLLISQQKRLLEKDPRIEKSISMRENIVLPLLVMQQYALYELRTNGKNLPKEQSLFLRKLILKSMAPNINATRNSV